MQTTNVKYDDDNATIVCVNIFNVLHNRMAGSSHTERSALLNAMRLQQFKAHDLKSHTKYFCCAEKRDKFTEFGIISVSLHF